ncbi:MAG: hypothetical protein R3E10_00995 [Gemmatimonadota bacterium]
MPRDAWASMPDSSRLWAFGTDRPLTAAEERRLLEVVDGFLDDWRAHGHPLRAARDWREGRFLLVAVDQASEPPSGCSIDALVRTLKSLEDELALGLVDHAAVWFRDSAGAVIRVSRSELKNRIGEGVVGSRTPVFDLTVTRLGQVLREGLEREAASTWVGRAYRLEVE